MDSTLKLLQQATGTEKFTVLATMIDMLMAMQTEMRGGFTLEEQAKTLDVEELASQYGVAPATMKAKLIEVLGDGAVCKVGKRLVIRQVRFLEYLRLLENPTNNRA